MQTALTGGLQPCIVGRPSRTGVALRGCPWSTGGQRWCECKCECVCVCVCVNVNVSVNVCYELRNICGLQLYMYVHVHVHAIDKG